MRATAAAIVAALIGACCGVPAASAAAPAASLRLTPEGITVGAAGWRPLVLPSVAGIRVTALGFARSRSNDYLDSQRDAAVVAGTLAALSTLSLL
jgi:hypothetical protein